MTEQNTKQLILTRTFNASRTLVFEAFTKAEHLANWWGPKGMKLEVIKLDVRPGGIFHYSMEAETGHKMWGIFKYEEINEPNSITFINAFADSDGNIIRAPFSPVWPLEIYNIWTFTETDNQTTITLKGYPVNASDEENKFFESMHASMEQGFGGTFEQFSEYLAKIKK